MVKKMGTVLLICVCVVFGMTSGEDSGGFFLLTGAAFHTVFKTDHEYFSTIAVSTGIETLAFDPISRRVYYGTMFNIHLYSMMLDGTDIRVEGTTDLYIQAIAIDSVAGYMFACTWSQTSKMYRVVLGEEPTLDLNDIIHTGEMDVFYLAVDPKTRTLFWESNTGVWQSNYDGTQKTNILSRSGYGYGNEGGITVDDENVYVILDNKIFKIDRSLNQTFTEIFKIRGFNTASGLVIVGDSLYFGNSTCVYSPTHLCNSFIETVQKDGTGHRKFSPVLSSNASYSRLSLAYVTGSENTMTTTTCPVFSMGAKNVSHGCNNNQDNSGHLKYPMVPVVCLGMILAIAVPINLL